MADKGGGIVDLRLARPNEDPELRRLQLGRATKVEQFGPAEQVGSARWVLKPGMEPSLRDLGIRADIITTMHRAMSRANHEPDISGFTLDGEEPTEPVTGRLVERGLHHH